MDIQRGGRVILISGLTLVLVGLVWGLVVPQTPFPRLALTAHTEFEVNGILLIVLAGLLLKFRHSVGPRSVAVMVVYAWLAWLMMASEVANSWWGTKGILPIAAAQAGATGGAPWQETFVTLAHVVPGLTLILAWALLLIGFVRGPATQD